MSDMITRLDDIASEVGVDAADRLTTPLLAARLAGDVRRGVRKRRAIAAGLMAVIVAMVGTAAVVLPPLLRSEPLAPANQPRVPVQTEDGLIAYDDGSMQVLDHRGKVVNVPPPVVGAPVFMQTATPDACAADMRDLVQGWVPQFTDAFSLVSFGRPLLVDATGYHGMAQGQRVSVPKSAPYAQFAFSVDVDPAIAPFVVMTLTSYAIGSDGRVAYFSSRLESQPAVDYTGDKAAGTYTATLTTRPIEPYYECKGQTALDLDGGVPHYLTATVFLNDGHGHLSPIATHNSWMTLVKEDG